MNEPTTDDSSKKLVRVWDRDYNLRGQQFVHWNNGFTIDAADPMAVELWDNRELLSQVTVESTNELAWYIDRLDRTSDGLLVVTCQPHLDVLRKVLHTDAYLVDQWLAAEKRHITMADDLHTRIAGVLHSKTAQPMSMYDAEVLAYEVIQELGLRQEWLTEQSSRLGLSALTKPEHPIATRTSSPWIAQDPAPRRLWDIFAEADEGQ